VEVDKYGIRNDYTFKLSSQLHRSSRNTSTIVFGVESTLASLE